MADILSAEQITRFLQELGKRYPKRETLYLLGGSALLLLGSNRSTLDIDYIGDDNPARWNDLQRLIAELSAEMDLKVDAVPYDEMIPPLGGTTERQIEVGAYGNLEVVVLDPYAIAIGKLERGFPSDLEDVVFLVLRGYIQLAQLEQEVLKVLPKAREFDLNIRQLQESLATVRQLLKS